MIARLRDRAQGGNAGRGLRHACSVVTRLHTSPFRASCPSPSNPPGQLVKVPNWRVSRNKELISCPGKAGKAPRGLGEDAVPWRGPCRAGLGQQTKTGAKATIQPVHLVPGTDFQATGVPNSHSAPFTDEDAARPPGPGPLSAADTARSCRGLRLPSLTPAQNRFTRRKCPNSAQLRPSCLCRTRSHGDDGVLQWPALLLASPPPEEFVCLAQQHA